MELPVSELSVINGVLKSMSSEERVRVFRMRPDRADVITFAADIFLEIAGQCGASVILVPTIGLAWDYPTPMPRMRSGQAGVDSFSCRRWRLRIFRRGCGVTAPC